MSGGVSKVSLVKAFINPGIDILTSWQGIVEIVLRGVILVLILAVLISSSTVQSQADTIATTGFTPVNLAQTKGAGGWLLFLSIIGLIYEVVVVLQRFINLKFVYQFITIFLIVDAAVHGVLAAGLFAGAVALASYIPFWTAVRDSSQVGGQVVGSLVSASTADALFSFLLIAVLIGAAVFMIVGGFVLKWNPTMGKYKASGGGGGGGGGGGVD